MQMGPIPNEPLSEDLCNSPCKRHLSAYHTVHLFHSYAHTAEALPGNLLFQAGPKYQRKGIKEAKIAMGTV